MQISNHGGVVCGADKRKLLSLCVCLHRRQGRRLASTLPEISSHCRTIEGHVRRMTLLPVAIFGLVLPPHMHSGSASLPISFGQVARTQHLSMSAGPIKVSQPSADELDRIKSSWGTWNVRVSTFPRLYSDDESAYFIKGGAAVGPSNPVATVPLAALMSRLISLSCSTAVTITPDDDSLPPVNVKAGDVVNFPAGLVRALPRWVVWAVRRS